MNIAVASNLRVAGDTHIGNGCIANEDAFLLDLQAGLFAVLDGMGGAKAGVAAAKLASETIHHVVQTRRKELPATKLLAQAISTASIKVYGASLASAEWASMGSTVVAALVFNSRIFVAHVGDSRAYLLRDHQFEKLTRDHTAAEDLVELGVLRREDVDKSITRNVLRHYLGKPDGAQCDVVERQLLRGDRVLLCSDGLYEAVSAADMRRVLLSAEPLDRIPGTLIDLALQSSNEDNITAVVISWEGT